MSYINNDLVCKPFAPITNNPSPTVYTNPTCQNLAKQCNKYFDNQCAHFQKLMHGLKIDNPCGCYNGSHREYICPQVSSGVLNTVNKRDCFNQPPSNLGQLSVCRRDSLVGQSDLPSFNGYASVTKDFSKIGRGLSQVDRGLGQIGGSFTVYPSDLNFDINDPVYNQCETIYHANPSYMEGPVYGNLADSCGLKTNYRPSKQPGLNPSTVRGPGLQTGPKMETSLCGDRQRCGNGACAPSQIPTLGPLITGCRANGVPKNCSWDDRALTSPWVYGQGTSDIATYYYDLSAETVGARPQFRAGTNNSIPPMMLINQTNLLGRQFGCRQPCWQTNCL